MKGQKTQRDRILEVLIAHGQPVPSYELAKIALSTTRGSTNFAPRGFRIRNHETTTPEGERHTSYTLEMSVPEDPWDTHFVGQPEFFPTGRTDSEQTSNTEPDDLSISRHEMARQRRSR